MSQKRYLQIVRFDDQLHYKDKSPIWIKLYCSLLDDYEFAQIADQTKFHAVGLMILAARLNNRLPDDEAWLRQKINANQKINLNLLLEIGFLEPIKGARKNRKNSFNGCNSKKTEDDVSRAVLENSENLSSPEQNRTEENKTEHNTTQQTRDAHAPDAENRVVCDSEKSLKPKAADKTDSPNSLKSSMFSLNDCLRYAELSPNVTNPQGLASKLFKTGEADPFILAKLYPERAKAEEAKIYGEPIQFTDEPCTVCFGSKMEVVEGKGARPCPHCKNERGKSTGFEPEGEKENESTD